MDEHKNLNQKIPFQYEPSLVTKICINTLSYLWKQAVLVYVFEYISMSISSIQISQFIHQTHHFYTTWKNINSLTIYYYHILYTYPCHQHTVLYFISVLNLKKSLTRMMYYDTFNLFVLHVLHIPYLSNISIRIYYIMWIIKGRKIL